MVDKLFKKKLYFSLLYAVTAVLLEVISFCVMGLGGFPVYWGIDVAFIVGFAVLIFIIPSSIASVVVSSVLLLAQAGIAFINEALYRMSGMVFSLNMLNLAKEVGGVFTADFINLWLLFALLLVWASELAVAILLHLNVYTGRVKLNRNAIIVLLVCCIIGENASMILYQTTIGSFQSTAISDELSDYNDDKLLYTTQFIPAKALRKFGFFGFYFMNISNTLGEWLGGGNAFGGKQELSALDNYFLSGEMSESAYGDNVYTGALDGKNIVLIVIESGEWYGINQEYTPTLYSLASEGIAFTEYYARDKTNHSEAMSILGSYPVNSDPSTKLKKFSLDFSLPKLLGGAGYTTNYFHANDGGFYNRNVTHGAGGTYGFDTAYFLEDMPALDGCDEQGNIIKNNFYDFDKDALVMENYESEYTYQKAEDRAFFTMQMTLSSHGNYDDLVSLGDYPYTGEEYAALTTEQREAKKLAFTENCTVSGFEKYYELIDGYPKTFIGDKGIKLNPAESDYSEKTLKNIYLRYKRFQAGMMDLDEGINSLISDLQSSGRLDDTAFVFYADHTAYYNSQNYYLKGVKEGEIWNTALYNIPCFMWYGGSMDCTVDAGTGFYEKYRKINFTASKDVDSPLKGGQTVDKFACSFDILPTILHLAGYSYNLNLYQGVSLFSPKTSTFISRESGIFTDKIYYDGITVSVKGDAGVWTQYDYESTLYSDEGFTDEVKVFLKSSLKYYEKQKMLEEMYKLDYFSQRPILGAVVKDGKVFRYIQRVGETFS